MSSEEVAQYLQAGDLAGAMVALAATAELVAKEMRKKLIRNALVMVGVLLVAVFGLWVGWQGHTAIREIQATRAESRLIVCENTNRDQLGARRAHTTESHDLIAAAIAADPRPETRVWAEHFNRKHDALIVMNYPLRDCSPRGIAEFYRATPTRTAGRGS